MPVKPKAKAEVEYTLAKAIEIPLGVAAGREPAGRRTVFGVDHLSVLIELDRDATAELSMDWDDAVRLGYVKDE